MTGKERAMLRSQANSLEPLFQIGKGGISDAFIKQAQDALYKRELIKLKVLLETSPITPRQAADEIAEKTGSEVVQVVGGSMIFYKYNPELHKDEKKKKR
ncbi:MAG: YhbY family RNA-binding protein [Clostridia bacterium]|nr:YhbY family RNA-binding protein [Clostridia bacterium]